MGVLTLVIAFVFGAALGDWIPKEWSEKSRVITIAASGVLSVTLFSTNPVFLTVGMLAGIVCGVLIIPLLRMLSDNWNSNSFPVA